MRWCSSPSPSRCKVPTAASPSATVPVMAPVLVLIFRPAGRPTAVYDRLLPVALR